MQHETLSSLTTRLAELTASFQQSFGHLNAGELNWKPNPQIWSIAQVLDHLIVINETYYPLIASKRAGTLDLPFWSKFGWAVRFFGNFILKSVEPGRRRKMRTFPIWEPASSALGGDILERFVQHQAAFGKFMESCRDLVGQGAVIHSPASRVIVYTVEKAFEIIVTHEERHLNQANEILELMRREKA